MITVDHTTLKLSGEWVLINIDEIEKAIKSIDYTQFNKQNIILDGAGLSELDTSGSYIIIQLTKTLDANNASITLANFHHEFSTLVTFITQRMEQYVAQTLPDNTKKDSFLTRIGRTFISLIEVSIDFLAFIGEVSLTLFHSLLKPWKIRWVTLWANVQIGGIDALMIVWLLNFLIGVVIAYQGGALLKTYGANIFIVELVSIAMLRELAPLITAIIVAGRTGSAFAAQIGTMVVNEEVDALKTIGINHLDQLVIPKLFALLIALPFLTLFGGILSVFGGMVLASAFLDVSFTQFIERIPQVMSINTLLIGLAKTPIFAIIIALTGCYQGFKVAGGADSVGKQTTIAVVQSIFLVIICDALFSVVTRNIGL